MMNDHAVIRYDLKPEYIEKHLTARKSAGQDKSINNTHKEKRFEGNISTHLHKQGFVSYSVAPV